MLKVQLAMHGSNFAESEINACLRAYFMHGYFNTSICACCSSKIVK